MSDDLVKRLRDWEHVWPQDLDEPEGGLYLTAADRIEELEVKLAKAVDALGEAIYLLDPDEEDIAKETGLYRIVTTYAELTGENDE
jgi:hypothetical protein